jgi:hypothetical protein
VETKKSKKQRTAGIVRKMYENVMPHVGMGK